MAEEDLTQACYSLTQLAKLMGTNRKKVRRLLWHAGISSHLLGKKRMVFVSDIETKLPALWASVASCERRRAIARALEYAERRSPAP